MQEQKNITQADDEIDLIALAKTLWEGRKTVIKTTIIFMLIGLFVAIFSEKEYTASCTMVPQSAEGGSKLGGSLGGLAAMAGINLGSMGGGASIPPTLYPKVIESVPFRKELMKTPLTIVGEPNDVTFEQYFQQIYKPGILGYVKKYTIGLPRVVLAWIRSGGVKVNNVDVKDNILSITYSEKLIIDKLATKLSLNVNEKGGYISISASMPEAKAAAQLAQKAQVLLQDAITNFKIQKAEDQLVFVEERYFEKQKEAEVAQQRLAQFLDRNKNVSTAIAQTERERLNAEYNLAYGVYSELAKQLETQKIKVKENTPVFTILKPVVVPFERSKPKRSLVFMVWTFFGVLLGVGVVFGKAFLGRIRSKWHEESTC